MEKHFVGRKKRRNGKEKWTEMKSGKNENLRNLYENLITKDCLNKD